MMNLFITGTDTDVGKTVSTLAILQALNSQGIKAVGYKPIADQCIDTPEGMRNKDALLIHGISQEVVSYDDINPIKIKDNYNHENRIDFSKIKLGLENLNSQCDTVVIEGNGGWRYLLDDNTFYTDWLKGQKVGVILVVGIQHGCVNHTLLTAEAIRADGLPLVGWIANRINPGLAHYAQIISRLQKHLKAPLLGEIPYLLRPEEKELCQYLDKDKLKEFMCEYA
ncbi:dethiobiotin synthase [Providencia vermicola]|uniref:ATP-dependent dethiobiotin synthetase BioD n=4 Tax=Providencia TaxID=586 RepID=A0AAI9HZ49_PROST|nr:MULTISPECIES: dethiobiotin synthase [Providencia]ELR5043608.1 dethiobiotin synthase [Providencia rettgeri]ELR5035615.1 dethiobiotin synthase [Providencia stuartii]ELR5119893.1 dethiobiotin synthase [Providencia stuartii]ELR5141641.1 dethiobiotin synthase [Providencia stuartii]ELR5290995.1 dethiobiotin synthase [Providencia stuartii]